MTNGRWFRFYDDSINDPKVLRLPEVNRWWWIAVLCIASKNDGLVRLADVPIYLRVNMRKAEQIVDMLKLNILLDEISDNVYTPHNWNGRQYKSDVSTDRVQQFRKRKRNVSSVVSETPPDTDTEPERKKDAAKEAAPENSQTADAEVYQRGKQVLGTNAGGLIRRLIASKSNNLALARAALETASTKQNPREYIGAIVNGKETETKDWRSAII